MWFICFPKYVDKRLKKTKDFAKPVNEECLLNRAADTPLEIEIRNALGAKSGEISSVEMDEMWNFCYDKSQQVWL